MISFRYLDRMEFRDYASRLFDIMEKNTAELKLGNTVWGYDDWNAAITCALSYKERHIVLIYSKKRLIGFFMYCTRHIVLRMEEIQLRASFHGRANIFRQLFAFVLPKLPDGITTVDAYTVNENVRSQQILLHLGLKPEGRDDTFINFRGDYADLLAWFENPPKRRRFTTRAL